MLFISLNMVLFLALLATVVVAARQTPPECIDRERNNSLEYFSMVRYKSVGTLKPNFACYMVTQCSIDRLERLGKQLRAWEGATSVAIYIPTTDNVQQIESVVAIDTFLTSLLEDVQYNGWLIVSLLFGHEASPQLWNCTEPGSPGAPTYPINALRNLAVAATGGNPHFDAHHIPPYLLYLDVDFLPSAGLSDWIHTQALSTGYWSLKNVTSRGGVVVLPAFENTEAMSHSPTRPLEQLLKGIKTGIVKQFHVDRFPAGHDATDYERWSKASSKFNSMEYQHHKPYAVTYARGYEPYIIMARSAFVPYDERFRGYGFNKGINARWLSENGTTFYVQPGHFVVEDVHPVPEIYKKYKKYVDFTPYYKAVREMAAKRMPLISSITAHLLIAAGFGAVATENPAAHKAYVRTLGADHWYS